MKIRLSLLSILGVLFFTACQSDEAGNTIIIDSPAVENQFNGSIDFHNLENYANQTIPNYINKDNTTNNSITDMGATLGRVLFYDVNLSSDNSVSCASCHQQEHAFSDTDLASVGVNGTTGRHSMRLINTRFAEESRFFWDERANTLEEQTTQPIQDHAEMGFSGTNGDGDLNDLISKLEAIDYYEELFTFVYGDANITEERMQLALAQFIRSIQSFDAKYDEGRSLVNNDNQPFPNFTNIENAGKTLFQAPPTFNQQGVRIGGGVGCNGCHRAPEFDIDRNSRNNGITGIINSTERDFLVTRSPTLRDMVKMNGQTNGAFFHNGGANQLLQVINHYNTIVNVPDNNNLDNRLLPNGQTQQLNLTEQEKVELLAFLQTLSGSDVYTNNKWSNPF